MEEILYLTAETTGYLYMYTQYCVLLRNLNGYFVVSLQETGDGWTVVL